MNKQKGQALIFLLVGILVIAAIGGAFYLGKSTTSTPSPIATSQTPQSTPTSSSVTDASPVPNGTGETANWREYNFEPFKLNFKYPLDWFVASSGSAQFPTIRIQNYDPNTAPARGYDPQADKGKYFLQITRLPWGNSGTFNLSDLRNKIPKDGEEAYYIGDPAGKVVIKTEREFEINGFPALYREKTYTNKPEVSEEVTYILDKTGYTIEVVFNLDKSSGKVIMNQILSTFRFTQ